MTSHTIDPLRGSGILEVLDLPFTVSTLEACCAKGLILCENDKVLNLVITDAADIRALVAYEGPIAGEEEVCVRVNDRIAGVTAETVYVPSIAR